jgi:HSP20 family protein
MFLMRRDLPDLFDLFRESDDQPRRASWHPAVESFSKDGKVVLRMELPGVEPDKVDVTLDDGRLTIRGEKQREGKQDKADFYLREIAHGKFERSFTLPEGVNADGIEARHVNGVLQVTIPVEEETSKTRKIPVETGKGWLKKSA